MAVPQQWSPARPDAFRDGLIRPFVSLVAIAGTIAQWSYSRVLFPSVALVLFILVSIAAIGALFPWTRLSGRQLIAAASTYMVLGSLLLPLGHSTTAAAVFPYLAASNAGGKLASRKAAVSIAAAGSLVAAGADWLVQALSPDVAQWPWWMALTVGLPVYIGISQRDRREALHSAQRAAEEAQRARESETREAALLERGRIAREIHDVLGHSLSGIALQLDMADALRDSGREEESTAAVRRARALAVDSISETRRAVHALREDSLPLPDALSQLAERSVAEFAVSGEVAAVGPEATHTMVRAAQEALTNATKYAPGAERTVHLAFTAEHVTLTVRNGPATAAPPSDLAGGTGLGLAGMGERVALLGGTLRAESTQDGGWIVEVELPR